MLKKKINLQKISFIKMKFLKNILLTFLLMGVVFISVVWCTVSIVEMKYKSDLAFKLKNVKSVSFCDISSKATLYSVEHNWSLLLSECKKIKPSIIIEGEEAKNFFSDIDIVYKEPRGPRKYAIVKTEYKKNDSVYTEEYVCLLVEQYFIIVGKKGECYCRFRRGSLRQWRDILMELDPKFKESYKVYKEYGNDYMNEPD